MIVLAYIPEGVAPPGVQVLAHLKATGNANGRHGIDGAGTVVHSQPMLLTIDEAADELRLSPRQVQRLVRDGELPSIAIGTARRIARSDLAVFVTQRRQGVNRTTPERKVAREHVAPTDRPAPLPVHTDPTPEDQETRP